MIDTGQGRQRRRLRFLKRVAVGVALAATFFLVIAWAGANAVIRDGRPPEGADAAMIGLVSCSLIIVGPIIGYFVIKAILLWMMGKTLGTRDPAVRAPLDELQSKFPEYILAIGGREAALDARRRKKHDEYYFFCIPGSREKRAAVKAQLAALSHADGRRRVAAANALGEMGDPHGIGPLFDRASADGAIEVRAESIRALARIHDPRASERLSELLRDKKRKLEAAVALAEIRDRRAVDPLLALICSTKSEKWKEAVKSLSLFPTAVSLQGLLGLLADSDLMLRVRAADALGLLGEPGAIEPLLALMRDSAGKLHLATAEAVAAIAERSDDSRLCEIGEQAATAARQEKARVLAEKVRLSEVKQLNCRHTWGAWRLHHEGGREKPGTENKTCDHCGKSEERECEHEFSVFIHDESYGDYHMCKRCRYY